MHPLSNRIEGFEIYPRKKHGSERKNHPRAHKSEPPDPKRPPEAPKKVTKRHPKKGSVLGSRFEAFLSASRAPLSGPGPQKARNGAETGPGTAFFKPPTSQDAEMRCCPEGFTTKCQANGEGRHREQPQAGQGPGELPRFGPEDQQPPGRGQKTLWDKKDTNPEARGHRTRPKQHHPTEHQTPRGQQEPGQTNTEQATKDHHP